MSRLRFGFLGVATFFGVFLDCVLAATPPSRARAPAETSHQDGHVRRRRRSKKGSLTLRFRQSCSICYSLGWAHFTAPDRDLRQVES